MSSVSSFEFVDPPRDTIPAFSGSNMSPPITLEHCATFTTPAYPAHATLERDSDLYMECDMITFVVAKCLFKVPRFFLDRETAFFGKITDSEQHPIELSDVSRHDFKTLLYFLVNEKYDSVDLALPQLISLLSTSTHFEMVKIRAHVIKKLSGLRPSIDPIDQVVLALKHDIPAWITDAYTAICERDKPLTFREAAKLGGEIPFMIAEAREATIRAQLIKTCGCSSHSSQRGPVTSMARIAVDDVFGREEREKERERLAAAEKFAKQEDERIRAALEKVELEKNIKLKEAREAKEKAEVLIKEMEEGVALDELDQGAAAVASLPTQSKGKKVRK